MTRNKAEHVRIYKEINARIQVPDRSDLNYFKYAEGMGDVEDGITYLIEIYVIKSKWKLDDVIDPMML